MVLINDKCIACDICRVLCPVECIVAGDPIYIIENKLCVECRNYYENPRCVDMCPVQAITIKED